MGNAISVCRCTGTTIQKYVVSMEKDHYQILSDYARRTKSGSDFPTLQLSPSYEKSPLTGKQDGFTYLLTLAKFSVKLCEDEIGYTLYDVSESQVPLCIIRRPSHPSLGSNFIISDIQGNELVRVGKEQNAPEGSRQIGSIEFRTYCLAPGPERIFGGNSDFYLSQTTTLNGTRFYSSQNNEEVGQVFTPGNGINGFFAADLELGMKIGVIMKAIAMLERELHQRNYVHVN